MQQSRAPAPTDRRGRACAGCRTVLRHQCLGGRAARAARGAAAGEVRFRGWDPYGKAAMSFKLTYATMFDPPAQLHASFDSAVARARAKLGSRHALHVAGEERGAAHYFVKTTPTDCEQVLGEFPAASAADAADAVRAAATAWQAWKRTSPARRAQLLRRVAGLIEERVYDIAAALTLEVGKNRMEALAEAQETADFFTLYAEQFERHGGFDRPLPDDPLSTHVSHNRSVLKPYGPWVVIAPFNFPLALAGGPVAAALVTGNTVIVKGATATPWAGRLLADCVRDAGLPSGVFNYLSGQGEVVGATLIADPAVAGVTFTGSHEVGMRIARALQGSPFLRPCIAEMGGKNACIVTPAADLERAATGIVRSAFGMGGQKCSALSRLYVHRDVADALHDKIMERVAGLRIGDPALKDNWLGPVTTRNGYDSYARYVDQLRAAGSRVLCGGEQLRDGEQEQGFFVRPTLAEAPPEHPLWQVEMFLPILMTHRVS